jgi:hypothetical protein
LSADASRYYNYCTDGSTSPGNYGYHDQVSFVLNIPVQIASTRTHLNPDYLSYFNVTLLGKPMQRTWGSGDVDFEFAQA